MTKKLRYCFIISLLLHGILLASHSFFYGNVLNDDNSTHEFIIFSYENFEKESQVNLEKKILKKIPNIKRTNSLKKNKISNKPVSIKKQDYDIIPFSDNCLPQYPDEARKMGMEARFVAKLTINNRGFVESINFDGASIYQCFVIATYKTLKKWRFHRKGTQTIEVSIPIQFVLSR